MSTLRILIAISLLALVGLAAAPAAHAEPSAADIDAAKQHFANGQELFNKNDLKGAVDEFKEAFRLSQNPVLLYNIGFVYDKLNDKPLAVHYYQKFIDNAAESPKIHDKRVEVQGRLAELQKQMAREEPAAAASAPASQPKPPAEPPQQPAETKVTGKGEFLHTTIEEAPPGKPLDVVARVPEGSGWTPTLYFRTAGMSSFASVAMRPRMGDLVARIPAAAMTGSSIQYYIEVKDSANKLVAQSGRASTPNIIPIDAGAKPHYYVETPDATTEHKAAGGPGLPDETESPLVARQAQPKDTDTGTRPLVYAKWATTGLAAVLLGAGLAFYLTAGNYSTTLEGEAFASGTECPSPPCRTFNDQRKDLEATGQMYNTLTTVTLAAGLATAVGAGVLWYLDRGHGETPRVNQGGSKVGASGEGHSIVAVPMIGEGVVGGAAVVRF